MFIYLFRYNNKTYRVDDINWDMNPSSTFKKFDGTEISFVEYYATNYEKKINDLQQPLLISRPKKRVSVPRGSSLSHSGWYKRAKAEYDEYYHLAEKVIGII